MERDEEPESEITRRAALEQHQAGMALAESGRFREAVQSYRRALALRPDYPEAHNNLGNALYALGLAKEAVGHYRRTLERLPGAALVHNNLAKALVDTGAAAEAERSFLRALELEPEFPAAHSDLAIFYQRCARFGEAVRHYRRALELGFVQAHGNLANTLKELGQRAGAERHFRLAVQTQPASAAARTGLGLFLRDEGAMQEAQTQFARALELDPDHAGARWAAAMTRLPVVPESQAAAERGRAEFAAEIGKLERWFDDRRTRDGWMAIGVPQPFYLAYQETNNRELLSRYGRICARIMGRWQEAQGLQMLPPAPATAVRVGIVSAQFTDHSVWHALVKGWLKHADRNRIEYHLFAADPREDAETAFARAHCAQFEIGERGLSRWAAVIRERRLDALIYPEIGMNPLTMKLACLRLAPVQVAAWGHPETTGLPTIDHYLSAAAFEPAGAQDNNYSERLVALPGIGCCYDSPAVKAALPDLAALGIDPQLPMLLCPGTPFKYAPAQDRVLAVIARRLGPCQLIFFHGTQDTLSRRLEARLRRSFADAGLALERHTRFIPWQPRPEFHGLLQRAHVFLDTIGFSGFNTAIQAVECALPIVSREGRFMRGRLASGILKRIGLKELIAATEKEYVDLVVRLATDAPYRDRIRAQMVASRPVLFGDLATVRALEDFLLRATARR